MKAENMTSNLDCGYDSDDFMWDKSSRARGLQVTGFCWNIDDDETIIIMMNDENNNAVNNKTINIIIITNVIHVDWLSLHVRRNVWNVATFPSYWLREFSTAFTRQRRCCGHVSDDLQLPYLFPSLLPLRSKKTNKQTKTKHSLSRWSQPIRLLGKPLGPPSRSRRGINTGRQCIALHYIA